MTLVLGIEGRCEQKRLQMLSKCQVRRCQCGNVLSPHVIRHMNVKLEWRRRHESILAVRWCMWTSGIKIVIICWFCQQLHICKIEYDWQFFQWLSSLEALHLHWLPEDGGVWTDPNSELNWLDIGSWSIQMRWGEMRWDGIRSVQLVQCERGYIQQQHSAESTCIL